MQFSLPFQTDKSVTLIFPHTTITTSTITSAHTSLGAFDINIKINGFDACNRRVTNIVGFDGNDFLQECPSCHNAKIVDDFGTQGRITNGVQRSQSHCIDCRKK